MKSKAKYVHQMNIKKLIYSFKENEFLETEGKREKCLK